MLAEQRSGFHWLSWLIFWLWLNHFNRLTMDLSSGKRWLGCPCAASSCHQRDNCLFHNADIFFLRGDFDEKLKLDTTSEPKLWVTVWEQHTFKPLNYVYCTFCFHRVSPNLLHRIYNTKWTRAGRYFCKPVRAHLNEPNTFDASFT